MKDNHFQEYGRKLKHYREQAGVTQVETAMVCGVSPLTVSSWECGRTLPSMEHCRKLTNLYGMPPEVHEIVKVAQMSRNQLIKSLYELMSRV